MDSRVDHANPYTNQIFQEAVIQNDFAIVKLLLKYGIYPRRNERNRQGLTALQQSVLDGHRKMAILLLEAGADIEAKTSNGWTCLHIASALGDLEILTTMINHCADLIALTKNEELPIDLASTRDIKIKLAKEMSRVGYSELAQWYMRKLAASEGIFYVSISADRLLDLACDDHYDKSYSNDYPYYMTHYNNQQEVYIASPVHRPSSLSPTNQSTSHGHRQGQEETKGQTQHSNIWLEISETANIQYLTYSNGYEEVIESPLTEQARARISMSSIGSPSRKPTDSMRSITSLTEESENDAYSRSYVTLKKNSQSETLNSMQRKPSKIELHIDYTNSTEDDADDSGDAGSNSSQEHIGSNNSFLSQSGGELLQRNHHLTSSQTEEYDKLQTRTGRPNSINDIESESPEHQKGHNVRFNTVDSSNEFCNCPNCKKMGYAFSPDIRTSSRKIIHVGQEAITSPGNGISYGVIPAGYLHSAPPSYIHPQYYPATTTSKHPLDLRENQSEFKPRKRKKKLFSGIRSMFKDNIRIQRTNEQPLTEDAGILFAVSLRDRNKAKGIQQRHFVRKSNSFSGRKNEYISDEVNVYSHDQVVPRTSTVENQVVPPPAGFADRRKLYLDNTNINEVIEDDVFDTKWTADEYNNSQNYKAGVVHSIHTSGSQSQNMFDELEKDIHRSNSRNNDGLIYRTSLKTNPMLLDRKTGLHYLEGAI